MCCRPDTISQHSHPIIECMSNCRKTDMPGIQLVCKNACKLLVAFNKITFCVKDTTAELRAVDETSIPEPSGRQDPTEALSDRTAPSSGGRTAIEGDPCIVRPIVLAPNNGGVGTSTG